MTKFYAQEKRVFDINKVTVVGSPTITSDGVASGFTTANYIASPTTLTINPNIFRICFEFTTGSDITTTQMIIRSMDGQNAFIIGLKSRKMRLYLNEGDSPLSWGVASDILSTKVLTANTKYNGYLGFNGFTYTLSLNNEDWITVKSSALIRSSFALKIGQGMSTEPFLGSVNLQAIRVYSNNELVYSPTKPICYLERRKEGFDLSKFTVVGSPTITEDGVASGFSEGNYITVMDVKDLKDKSWTIKTNFINKGIIAPTRSNTLFKMGTWSGWGGILVVLHATRPHIMFTARTGDAGDANNEGQWAVKYLDYVPEQIGASMSFDITTGTYTAKVDFGEGEQIIGTYIPTTENKQLYYINVAEENKLKLQVGSGSDKSYNHNATDLSQFSITVDGKEVFTGAKEKFYAMRGM